MKYILMIFILYANSNHDLIIPEVFSSEKACYDYANYQYFLLKKEFGNDVDKDRMFFYCFPMIDGVNKK